jgi:hypothetical protein
MPSPAIRSIIVVALVSAGCSSKRDFADAGVGNTPPDASQTATSSVSGGIRATNPGGAVGASSPAQGVTDNTPNGAGSAAGDLSMGGQSQPPNVPTTSGGGPATGGGSSLPRLPVGTSTGGESAAGGGTSTADLSMGSQTDASNGGNGNTGDEAEPPPGNTPTDQSSPETGCTPQTCIAAACETAECQGDVCVHQSLCADDEECCAGECVPAECDDDVDCTDDSCGADGCEHTPRDDECPGSNECQTAVCDIELGCLLENQDGTCDDGTFCNGQDSCMGGQCSVHAGPPCAGQSQCDEQMNSCVGCAVDSDCPSEVTGSWSSCEFSDTCDTEGTQTRTVTEYACVAGDCQPSPREESQSCTRSTNGLACGDTELATWSACDFGGSTCAETGVRARTRTEWACQSGRCQSNVSQDSEACTRNTDTTACSNGQFCDGEERCSNGACQPASSPCGGATHCSESLDACVACLNASHCDDGDPCTVDSCNTDGTCRHDNNDGQACACGTGTCICQSGTCTSYQADSLDICGHSADPKQPAVQCIATAQCKAPYVCAPHSFGGRVVGNFCLPKNNGSCSTTYKIEGASWPVFTQFRKSVSVQTVEGDNVSVCVPGATTCEGLRADRMQISGCSSDADCGAPGFQDAHCAFGNECHPACEVDADCIYVGGCDKPTLTCPSPS